MLCVWRHVEALSHLVPSCSALALPRPHLQPVAPDELSMAQKVLVWSGPYQGPASRSFSTEARLELEQVGTRSKGEGRGKTRDQLQRGEPVGR